MYSCTEWDRNQMGHQLGIKNSMNLATKKELLVGANVEEATIGDNVGEKGKVAPATKSVPLSLVIGLNGRGCTLVFFTLATFVFLSFIARLCAKTLRSDSMRRRLSHSISSVHRRFKYFFACFVSPSFVSMVKRLNTTWSYRVSAFFRLAAAICSVARACARSADSLFAKSHAFALVLLFHCGLGGRLKNPSLVTNFILELSPLPLPSALPSTTPLHAPYIPHSGDYSCVTLALFFPMALALLSMPPYRF